MTRSKDENDVLSGMDRRGFLWKSGWLAAAAVWASRGLGAVQQNAKFSDYPFQLGVASGDPTPDGFVLWTRLAPKPLVGGGMPAENVEVRWQVAHDEKMNKVVKHGTIVATPDWAHSVHVEVDGLTPDRWYFYQFRAGNEVSPIGRTRTMPESNTSPAKVRFAFTSCQHFETGLYTAYEHMLKDDVDLVLQLGDYIYEGPPTPGRVRLHVGPKLDSLDDYRNRHAQYKTDLQLQGMHAGAPWMVAWDDHEIENNWANSISQDAKVTPQQFLEKRARAAKAYYEHMPLRRTSLPSGPDIQLYRTASFGQLANFFVLDTRQYRTDQPCGDGGKAPCQEVFDPNATLLGTQQEQWLHNGLAHSPSVWNVLAQQVLMARVDNDFGPGELYGMDVWSGYEVNRRRLLKFFHERKISNPVVLGGDIHSNWANNLIADFDNLDSKVVGTEFVATSLSSDGNGTQTPMNLEQILKANPFVKWFNAERGYVLCNVSPQEWRTDFRVVEIIDKPGAPVLTRKSFVIENGRPGLQPA